MMYLDRPRWAEGASEPEWSLLEEYRMGYCDALYDATPDIATDTALCKGVEAARLHFEFWECHP